MHPFERIARLFSSHLTNQVRKSSTSVQMAEGGLELSVATPDLGTVTIEVDKEPGHWSIRSFKYERTGPIIDYRRL